MCVHPHDKSRCLDLVVDTLEGSSMALFFLLNYPSSEMRRYLTISCEFRIVTGFHSSRRDASIAGSGQGDRAAAVPSFVFFFVRKEQKSTAVMNGCSGFWRPCGTAGAGCAHCSKEARCLLTFVALAPPICKRLWTHRAIIPALRSYGAQEMLV